MNKILLFLIIAAFLLLPKPSFAQVPCNGNSTVCGQTAYDTCTPVCNGTQAAYDCYQASNQNCRGTILCAPENSRCQVYSTPAYGYPTPAYPTPAITPTCQTDCNKCPTTTTCGTKTYDTCKDDKGQFNSSSSFCQNGAQKFRCFANGNTNCTSSGAGVINEYNYSCSACGPVASTPSSPQPSVSPSVIPTEQPSSQPSANPSGSPIPKKPVKIIISQFERDDQILDPQNPNSEAKINLNFNSNGIANVRFQVNYDSSGQDNVVYYVQYKLKQASTLPAPDENGITHLTSCAEITKPGNYVLDQDLTGENRKVCINIHSTGNINLDCNNRMIRSKDPEVISTLVNGVSSAVIVGTIFVNKVNDFTIKNCNLPTNNIANSSNDALGILSSSNGLISNTQLDTHVVSIQDSKNISFQDNSVVRGWLFSNFSPNTSVIRNKFIIPEEGTKNINGTLAPYFILSFDSSSIKILNNTFMGQTQGVGKHDGVDDAIAIGNYSSDLNGSDNLIENNTISTVYDCGIETLGRISNSKFNNNSIKNTGYCAIGGWYDNSWLSNTVSNNTAENVPQLFAFFWDTMRAKSDIPESELDYFKDNSFINNKLISQKNPASYHPVYFFFQQENAKPKGKFVLGNNVFKNNDFGKSNWPYFYPYSMIVDGGGNICQQYPDKDFPLKCVGETTSQETTSQVQHVQQVIPPSVIPEKPKLPGDIFPSASPTITTQPKPSSVLGPLQLIDFNHDGVINAFDTSILFAKILEVFGK